MTLYSKNGAYPTELPAFDTDSSGNTWTDLANNPNGLRATGWIEATPPAYDSNTQDLAWSNGSWAVVAISKEVAADRLAERRQAKSEVLAARRWAEQQSFTFNGRVAPSDNDTIALVAAKVAVMQQRKLKQDSAFTWKPAPGVFVQFTLATLIAYGQAIDDHVQACFNNEAALYADLMAKNPDDVDIGAGWP